MKFKFLFLSLLGAVAFQVKADRGPIMDQSCGEDKVASREAKLRPRPNASYVLLGDSVLSRFDTNNQQRIYFYHRTVKGLGTDRFQPLPFLPEMLPNQVRKDWREYPKTRNDMRYTAALLNKDYIASTATEIGHERGDRFNGHVSQRFTPNTVGPHDIIALYTRDVESAKYSSALYFEDITFPVGFFCVVHRFNVHGKPTLNEVAVHEEKLPDGKLQFNATVNAKWAPYSEAAVTNRPMQIQWQLQTRCLDSGHVCRIGSQSWVSVGNGDSFSRQLFPGRYNLRATVNDGLSVVTRNYPIDNSNSPIEEPEFPPCDTCQIP